MNPRKHWPSLFLKSNSSTPPYNQLPETSYSSAMRAPYSGIGELPHNYVLERESSPPKAKTRWNPKPEQIQILESIFSSGMVNPPREEIKRIRAQLEVYGQVGDVNVFYWFQNRKSRSKRKPRLPAAQRSKSRTVSGTQSSTSSTSTSRSTSVQSRTMPDISNSAASSMHSNINGDQYSSYSTVPVSQFAGHHYEMKAMGEEMNRTSSVPSQTFTALLNSPPSPMHSNIGDQYSSYSTVPVSSFAGHHYNPQTVYEEMCKTSTSVPSQTFTALPNHPPNSMHSHNRDQYCSSSAVPVASSADDLYDMERLYEEMTKTSAFDQSKTITDVPKNPPNPMHCDIRDQYISSTAPVSSSAGQVYDLDSLLEEMSKTSASVWPQTVIDIPNSLPDSMHSNIQDQYYSSSAVPVPSPTEHLNNLDNLLEEMINYGELNNMQAAGTAAAGGGQNMLNEGTGAVQDGSTINTNPQISVFINDAQISVPSGPINFRDFFGDNALLFHSSGEPVLLNEFGFIILEHGAMYFLM